MEERLKQMPVVGNVLTIIDTYPRISAWVVLSVGIVALLIYEARDVGLTTTNWIALIVASVLVAGLCIWIVSWEDEEEMVEASVTSAKPAAETIKEVDEPKTDSSEASVASTEAAQNAVEDDGEGEADEE